MHPLSPRDDVDASMSHDDQPDPGLLPEPSRPEPDFQPEPDQPDLDFPPEPGYPEPDFEPEPDFPEPDFQPEPGDEPERGYPPGPAHPTDGPPAPTFGPPPVPPARADRGHSPGRSHHDPLVQSITRVMERIDALLDQIDASIASAR